MAGRAGSPLRAGPESSARRRAEDCPPYLPLPLLRHYFLYDANPHLLRPKPHAKQSALFI